jgi:hypothetical protein
MAKDNYKRRDNSDESHNRKDLKSFDKRSGIQVLEKVIITQSDDYIRAEMKDLFNGVLRGYRFFGFEGELKIFTPCDIKKAPYPMFFVEFVTHNHEISKELAAASKEGMLGITLSDLRQRPDTVKWWAPSEASWIAKQAFAFFLHGKEIVRDAAIIWWQEEEERKIECNRKQSLEKVNSLRNEVTRHRLHQEFPALTAENIKKFIRYTPEQKFGIVDEATGEALYVETDVNRIYVVEIDPGHPLVSISPVGLFINRAALRNSENGTPYMGMADAELAKRAYILRNYLRTHSVISKEVLRLQAARHQTNSTTETLSNVITFIWPDTQEETKTA